LTHAETIDKLRAGIKEGPMIPSPIQITGPDHGVIF
jgi:hypothetical protein